MFAFGNRNTKMAPGAPKLQRSKALRYKSRFEAADLLYPDTPTPEINKKAPKVIIDMDSITVTPFVFDTASAASSLLSAPVSPTATKPNINPAASAKRIMKKAVKSLRFSPRRASSSATPARQSWDDGASVLLLQLLAFCSTPDAMVHEGVFRVVGASKTIKQLLSGELPVSALDASVKQDVIAASGAIKALYRDIMEPLLTATECDAVAAAQNIDDMVSLLQSMPLHRRAGLCAILDTCYTISRNEGKNSMGASQLAISLGASLRECGIVKGVSQAEQMAAIKDWAPTLAPFIESLPEIVARLQ